MDFNESLLVDFSFMDDVKTPDPVIVEKKPVIEYDKETTERYRVLRLRKMDPITYTETDEHCAFQFKYKWDPYTGERQEEDPNGPLCFDPDVLIKYYYTKRVDKLWVHPRDETQGYYEGYYDDGVGAGDEFFLAGRGSHPEWYNFRIPIIDCYLSKDHNKQFITFGPKLTDDEIIEIDRLANSRKDNYKSLFGHKRPSLGYMKELYDIAISVAPKNVTLEEHNKIVRQAVDKLLKIVG